MSERPSDSRTWLAAVRRRWVAVLALATAGTAAGLSIAVAGDPVYLGRAGVVLPPAGADARGNPVRSIGAEARIAESAEVLARAGSAVQPALSPAAVRARVAVRPVTDDVLEVRARARSAAAAEHLADAAARAYVEVRTETTAGGTDAAVVDLERQADQLEERIRSTGAEIAEQSGGLAGVAAGSAEALRRSALIDSLRARAAETGRQLAEIRTKIATTRLDADLAVQGTRVVAAAGSARRPVEPRPLRLAAMGALIGITAGVGTAIALDRRDRRPRSAEAVAAAAGAPVLATVPVPARGARDRSRIPLPWEPSAPPPDPLRRALAALGADRDGLGHLVVVVPPGDRAAAAVALGLAALVDPQGSPARLAVVGTRAPAGVLRAAAAAADRSGGPDDGHPGPAVTAVVTGGSFRVPDPGRDGTTVATLAVTAGSVPASVLAALADACTDAGHPLGGVVVAGAGPFPTGGGGPPHRAELDAVAPAPLELARLPGPAAPGDPDPGEMVGFDPFVRVPALLAALRRNWRVVGAAALTGVAAAAIFSWLAPPQARARAGILVRHQSGTDPNRQIVTDVELLGTNAVAIRASERLGGRPDPGTLLASSGATALSTELLQVTSRAPGGDEAVRRADAMAGAFVEFRAEHFRRQSEGAAAALQGRRDTLAAELRAVDGEIAAAAADDRPPREVGELQSRRSVLGSDLAIANQQLAQLGLDTASLVAASRVVDPARALGGNVLAVVALNLMAGNVLGLAAGTGWVVLREVTAGRVAGRREVLAILGCPVAVSVGRVARRHAAPRLGTLRRGRRRQALGRVARHLHGALDRAAATQGRPALAVVSVDTDTTSAMAAGKLAEDLSRAGRSVMVADLTGRALVPRLLDAPDSDVVTVRGRASLPCVWLPPGGRRLRVEGGRRERHVANLRRRADAVVAVVALDCGPEDLADWARSAVVVVETGRTTAAGLRAAAGTLRAAGIRVDSAVVVGSGQGDVRAGAGEGVAGGVAAVWMQR